ncbi:glycosyl transferase, group 1 family protein [Verrucomicrobiia bacterium DG1235]|nr:glycosyl transferase, group 1 family protein [Verrucomicrobiae bacterium DG1235]
MSKTEQKHPRLLWLILGDVESYGFRRAFLDLMNTLKDRSIDIGFVSMYSGPFSKEVEEAGYPIWHVGAKRTLNKTKGKGWTFLAGGMRLMYSAVANQRAVANAIKSFKPNWIHVSNNSLLIAGGLASRLSGIPAYWHIHNTIQSKLPMELQPLSLQFLCKLFGVQAIANSRHTASSLGDSLAKAKVSYPGVNVSYFSIAAKFRTISKTELGVSEQLPVFMIAARFDPEKAQDRVVDAAIQLYKKGERFTLLLVGGPLDSGFGKSIVERVEKEGFSEYIKFVGQVDDPRPYFLVADVVVNSRIDAEPFGLSVVEAMLMGRPVLAYKLGGPSETVVDGLTGWLISDPSVEGYRKGLSRALEYKRYWSKMGCSARRIASAKFSLDETTNSYLKIVGFTDHVVEEELLPAKDCVEVGH